MNPDLPFEIIIPGLIIGAVAGIAFPTPERARPWALVLALVMLFVIVSSGLLSLVNLINTVLGDAYAVPILGLSILIGFVLTRSTQHQQR